MSNLTLEDIAELAGVSRSTVSRVVNEQPNVRAEVRKRVLEVIQDTGYHPNFAARTLASQRSWTLGLILPLSVSFFFTDPYYPNLTKGIAQACNQYDYTLAFFLVSSKEDEEKMFPRVSRHSMLDGVIVRLVDANMPLVVVGRPFRSDNVSYVDIDNVNSAYNAVAHLIRLGYQRIGTITGPGASTVGIDRKEGYRKALIDRGRAIDESLIKPAVIMQCKRCCLQSLTLSLPLLMLRHLVQCAPFEMPVSAFLMMSLSLALMTFLLQRCQIYN